MDTLVGFSFTCFYHQGAALDLSPISISHLLFRKGSRSDVGVCWRFTLICWPLSLGWRVELWQQKSYWPPCIMWFINIDIKSSKNSNSNKVRVSFRNQPKTPTKKQHPLGNLPGKPVFFRWWSLDEVLSAARWDFGCFTLEQCLGFWPLLLASGAEGKKICREKLGKSLGKTRE